MKHLGFFVLLLLQQGVALAHSRGETWSSITVSSDAVTISYAMAATDLVQHLPEIAYSRELDQQLPALVTDGFRVSAAGDPCVARDIDLRQTAALLEIRWVADCESTSALTIHNDALFNYLPNLIHISRVVRADGRIEERLFTLNDREWQLESDTDLMNTFTRYFALGFEHILTGFDHLAFLFAIILLTKRTVTLVLMITGFTIGHSITLALGVLGYAAVDSGAVEALIGFTIALVAAEVVTRRHGLDRQLVLVTGAIMIVLVGLAQYTTIISSGPNALTLAGLGLFCISYLKLSGTGHWQDVVNPFLTLLFGMIHGFGFAGLLTGIGLPTERMVPALVGFNLGVEAGQLAVLLMVLAGAYLVRRAITLPSYTVDTFASALCGLGVFLFVSRAL